MMSRVLVGRVLDLGGKERPVLQGQSGGRRGKLKLEEGEDCKNIIY